MKGARLHINFLIPIALILGLVMAVLNNVFAESWSQNAGTITDPALYTTLFCISIAFALSYVAHPERNREITKVRGVSLRLKHFHITTSYLFGGVIACSVNSLIPIVETLHLAFTGLAIATGYFAMILYPESDKGKTWSAIGFVVGVGGFLAAFLFHAFSIAWGEVIAAIPLSIQMWVTLKRR